MAKALRQRDKIVSTERRLQLRERTERQDKAVFPTVELGIDFPAM